MITVELLGGHDVRNVILRNGYSEFEIEAEVTHLIVGDLIIVAHEDKIYRCQIMEIIKDEKSIKIFAREVPRIYRSEE